MNITHDTESSVHLKLVGVTSKGNITGAGEAILNMSEGTGNVLLVFDSDSKGVTISSAVTGTYDLTADVTGTSLDLIDLLVTDTVTEAAAVSLKLVID